jgi:hypothetical protein
MSGSAPEKFEGSILRPRGPLPRRMRPAVFACTRPGDWRARAKSLSGWHFHPHPRGTPSVRTVSRPGWRCNRIEFVTSSHILDFPQLLRRVVPTSASPFQATFSPDDRFPSVLSKARSGTDPSPTGESAPQLRVLRCAGAHYHFREARKGPESGAIRFHQRNIL